jgi:hypothetical protein
MITKSYAKNGQSCRVTFQFAPKRGARSAAVLGEFNDWRPEAHPMERRADGAFHLTLSLPAGRRYRFRYLFDGESWANDEGADSYVLNQFGSEDAVLDLENGAPAAPAEGRAAAGARTRPANGAVKAKAGETKPGKAGKTKAAPTKSTPAKPASRKAAVPKAASPAEGADAPKPPRRRRAPEAE